MTAADTLEQRIVALEKGAQYDATQQAIREREIEFLATLRDIREQITKEAEEASSSSSGKGGNTKSSTEVKALEEENAKLKATIAKQQYRIQHLISGMEKLLSEK